MDFFPPSKRTFEDAEMLVNYYYRYFFFLSLAIKLLTDRCFYD